MGDVMIQQLILNIVGGITALLILVVGVVILSGYLMPEYIPRNYRTIMGIVMVVYGTYRLIMIWLKQRSARRYGL